MKKTFTLSIVLTLLTLYGSKTAAQCQANFSWFQDGPNVINFIDQSSSASAIFYSWDFGDGNYDFSQNPVHTYLTPGDYQVCLTIMDSNSATCTSQLCDTISVTGSIICNLSISNFYVEHPTCWNCANGAAYPYFSGGTAPYTYQWSNGATDNAITGVLPGQYALCITDANGCSTCDTVVIDTSSCIAGFTWMQTAPNVITFTNTSTGTTTYTNYWWDFADASYDYNSDPIHTFNTPGTYYVCLTISDTVNSNYCSSFYCATITVTGSVICNIDVYAYQSMAPSCGSCADGSAYAYATGGTAPYTYLWNTGDTTSSVSGLIPGQYSVCATDANGCSSCTIVALSDSLNCQASFYLFPDSLVPHLYYAVNNSFPSAASYWWDWGDGNTDTAQYPSHTYANAGFYNICLTVTYGAPTSCTSTYCDSEYVSRPAYIGRSNELNTIITVNVISPIELGVSASASFGSVKFYPNPASTVLSVSVPKNKEAVSYQVLSLQGAEVMTGTFGGQTFNLNIEALARGIYIMQLQGSNGAITHSKFIKE